MTFPAGLSLTRVIGSFFDGSGDPLSGEVIFTPSSWLESDGVIVVRAPVQGFIRDGQLDVSLLATDDPDVLPAGWHWNVSLHVGGRRRAWAAFLPASPATVDIDDLAPIEPVEEMAGYATLTQLTAEQTARIAGDGALDVRVDALEAADGAPTGPAGGALSGTYPNPGLSASTLATFDPAGAAATAQAAAAADATAKVAAHTVAVDPHGDRAYTDTGLSGKANTAHTHAAADVNSGTLAAARLPDATSGAKGAVQLAGDLAGTAAAPTVPGLATEAAARAAADALLIPLTQKGAASGVATLDGAQKIPLSQLPAITLSSYLGTVASQAAMLALTGEEGDWAIRSDRSRAWVITGPDPTQLSSWTELPSPTDVVLSVNGEVGAVTLDAADVGAIASAEKGANSGVATLDGGGDVPLAQLGNVPAAPVDSVNGQTGVVVLDAGDVGAADAVHQHAGSDITTGTVTAARLPDATTGAKGVVQLAGDLAGTAAAPTVPGVAVEAAARAAADALLIPLTEKAAANGVATLGADSKIPSGQLPAIAVSEYLGTVASQAAMLALVGERGDWALRSDPPNVGAWIVVAEPSSVLANWVRITTPADLVLSVNGQTGAVVLTKTDVGLGNVDNTSDANKPVSTATQTALNLKANDADVVHDTGAETVGGAKSFTNGIGAGITHDGSAFIMAVATALVQGLRIQGANAGDLAFTAFVGGDNQLRFLFRADGALFWGDGASFADTTLYRSAADTLKTDDTFIVGTPGTVAGSAVTIDGTQTLTNKSISGSQIDSGTVAAARLPDATTGAKGIVQLAGDLGGTAAAPTVPSLALLAPGSWTTPTFQSGAGAAVVGNPTVDAPAFRLESSVSGVVRGRGSVGITGGSPQFPQGSTGVFMNIPAPLRPSVARTVSIRTRGTTSTHTQLVILTNGDVYCANTALATGSDVPLDGVTYTI